jgi:hypothetical protein
MAVGASMQSLRELAKPGIATVWATLLSFIPGRRLYNWGGTQEEMQARFQGDELMLEPDVRFIRAITVDRPPSEVWPWVAQIGRGAGYYSHDLLDNGGKPSADHLLDIPPPTVGDRNEAIGKVMRVEPGREIVWQVSGVRFVGAAAALVLDYSVLPHGADSSRVVTLILGRVRGPTAWLARRVFEVMDYVMAPEQLRGLKWRVETYAERQKGEASAACAGAADHQRDGIAYAGQTEGGA